MDKTISLLPFIESGADGFLLDIPVLDQVKSSLHGHSYPFQIVDNGNNFSILVKAGIKVRHSEPFKSLFLLVQRDNYPTQPDELTFFTNADIDRIWHETITSYSMEKNVFIVPKQLNRDGKATPFRSLFFCKKMKKIFHPPCPDCGGRLDLCRNDEFLIKESLSPYFTSLKRYLYCPDCFSSKGKHDFYQFSRSIDDPVFIKDRFDLIKDFNRLRSTASGSFPCLDCPDHAECYITGEKALSYISFFSFYPFHMLFFNAEPVKAVDFIPFISGAPVEQDTAISERGLENIFASRKDSLFFFENDEKFYLEVLFLKLSFFEAFVRSLYQKIKKNAYPFVNLSEQSIWIRPSPQGSSLPFFWNFQLSIIGLISTVPQNHLDTTFLKSSSLHFLALLWFYTFFVNKDQGRKDVYNAVGRLAEKSPEDVIFSDYKILVDTFPSMKMENSFWEPDSRAVPSKWHEFGLKTIVSGLLFLHTEKNQGLKNDLRQFLGLIENLKQNVKQELFSPGATIASSGRETVATQAKTKPETDVRIKQACHEREAISLILKNLKTKWKKQEPEPSPSLEIDNDVLETVVLSSPETENGREFDDSLEKTVIFPRPEADTKKESEFDDLEPTRVISKDGIMNQKPDPSDEDDGDDLDKTVVIKPKK